MATAPHELFELLLHLFRRIVRRERGLKGYGALTLPQVVILDALQRNPKLKMRELAALLGIGMSTATGLVDRMLKSGLVTRARDLADRRVVWVSITPKGHLLFRQFRRARQETFKAMFRNLSAREQGLFISLFRRISQNLRQAPQ